MSNLLRQRTKITDDNFFIYGSLPFVGRVIVLDATLHVLEFVQHCKHIDEFAQSEQVGLRHKVLPSFSVAQTLHLATESFYGFPLQRQRNQDVWDWDRDFFNPYISEWLFYLS